LFPPSLFPQAPAFAHIQHIFLEVPSSARKYHLHQHFSTSIQGKMTITFRNGVSIGEIILYVPSLFVAIFLTLRHGFSRSAGWYFLIIFCLARIIGPAMQLATINAPGNNSLYTGYIILQNVGLSPLMLATIGLLSRLLENINKSHHTFINTRMIKLVETVITVGLILGIVGGVHAESTFQKTGVYHQTSLNKAGTALFILCWVAIALFTALISFSVSHADHGEKRILFAVTLALPFLLVRLIFSILSTFTTNTHFNLLTGSVTILLCVALIEEFIIVAIFMAIGVTLNRLPKDNIPADHYAVASTDSGRPMNAQQQQQQGNSGNFGNKVLNIAKKTIIGRIVMMFIPDNRERDIEMQHGGYVRK
jgi:hypothetical protein